LAAAPGVYSIDTAPYFDGDGVAFSVSPPIPINGLAPGSVTLYNTSALYTYFTSTQSNIVLNEGFSINPPLFQYQQQVYIL
jgi:hypothetical protein